MLNAAKRSEASGQRSVFAITLVSQLFLSLASFLHFRHRWTYGEVGPFSVAELLTSMNRNNKMHNVIARTACLQTGQI